MRLAISMAAKFRRYGAPMNDLIQEASLGLMKAADKFDLAVSTCAIQYNKQVVGK
jgi:DNA-directed RNA polymerase sigma subunit (sigma70/sigma32)